jgi:hypothetical protein
VSHTNAFEINLMIHGDAVMIFDPKDTPYQKGGTKE